VLAESMETIQNLLGASSLELDMDALGWSKDERELLLGAFDVSVAPIPALPTPDEKKPFQQITFMLSDPQAATMKHVVDRALKLGYGKDESGTNTNKNANAIAKVCEQWLALIESGTE